MGGPWCATCNWKSSVVICWYVYMVCAYFSSELTTTSWILLSYEVAKKVVPSWKWKERQGRRSSKSKVVTTDCRLDPGNPEYANKAWINSNDKKPPESMTDNTLSFCFPYNLHSRMVPKLRFHLHNNNKKCLCRFKIENLHPSTCASSLSQVSRRAIPCQMESHWSCSPCSCF